MTLKRNVIANILGSGWSALMSIIFVPLYIKYMGVESYGLVGVSAIVFAWLFILDMGMSSTISREMARFSGNAHNNKSILDLLKSFEIISFGAAIIVIFSILVSSRWLSVNWINNKSLNNDIVINTIIIIGFIAGTKLIEGVYRNALVGLQKQIKINIIASILATFRGLGAVFLLIYVSPSIIVFFLWQAIISIATVVWYGSYLYSVLPNTEIKSSFSIKELSKIKQYAFGMIGTTILVLLLTQIDKLILVKLITLKEYGYYTMAFSVANMLNLIMGPLSQAISPKFSQLVAKEDSKAIIEIYHKTSQFITVTIGVLAGYLIIFSDVFIMVWTKDQELTRNIAPLVSVLSLGTLLNMLMSMPYQMQLAHGWTSLSIKLNIATLIFILPTILILVPKYGVIASAWIWVAINAGYLFIGVHFMYRKILIKEKTRWLLEDTLKPLIVCFGLIFVFKMIIKNENIYINLIFIFLSIIFVSIATLLNTSMLKEQTYNIFKENLSILRFRNKINRN